MKRSMPVDDELQVRIAKETEDFISWETRVKRYDEEIDIEAERQRLQEEKQESAELQRIAFGGHDNSPPLGDDDEE